MLDVHALPKCPGESHRRMSLVVKMQTVTGFEIGQPYAISLLTMARQRTPVGNDLEIVLDLGLPTEQVKQAMIKKFTEYVNALDK